MVMCTCSLASHAPDTLNLLNGTNHSLIIICDSHKSNLLDIDLSVVNSTCIVIM